MLSKERIEYLKDILDRLSNEEEVSLKERLYLKKIADKDQKVSAWLTKARRLQQEKMMLNTDPIDKLVGDLDLGSPDPNSNNISNPEELGKWFSGAPSWVARS